jgi:Type II secretion system (T2SS), protein M subtype b
VIDGLTAVQRRLAALTLLAVTVGLLWLGLADPLIGYLRNGAEERLADLRALNRNRGLLVQEPQIRDALAAQAQSSQWARLYDSQKADKAVLQLESDLRELLKSPNNPTSMTAQAASTHGPLTRIAVKVTLSMPIDQWVATLERLRAHAKFLRIENLIIQSADYQVVDSNPTLAIQAEIAGYMVTAASPKI